MINALKYTIEEASHFAKDFDDLICGRRNGHMGHWEYNDLSLSLWNKFIKENYASYYIPKNEFELINRYAYLSAVFLKNEPLTFISRGPGTLFYKKEAVFLEQLSNIEDIVYIDACQKALNVSLQEGKQIRSNVKHHIFWDDFYNIDILPQIQNKQLNVSFGLTLLNIEGNPENYNPGEHFVHNLRLLRTQMNKGDHFITILDHNQNTESIEKAYSKQGEFAKSMLTKFNCLDPSAVNFHACYFKNSYTLSHGFSFNRDYLLHSSMGAKTFKKDETLWFNNSYKPPLEEAKKLFELAGFKYVLPNVPLDSQERLGWHHVEAI